MWRTKLDICLWLVKSSITKMATKSLGGYGKMVKSVTIVKGFMISLLAVISLSSFASAMLALQMGFDANYFAFTAHDVFIKCLIFLLASLFCFMLIMIIMSLD